ncbi:hypothetical protein CF326_g7005 [Tilletia indica]|nr:hypothetical protein CF326_g7005 [Tilletia indica]
MIGNSRDETVDVIFLPGLCRWSGLVDGQFVRTYRQASNASIGKTWAADDTYSYSRGINLAVLVQKDQPGLNAETWGF